jgi:uncharacterized membrane protein YgcG
MRKLIVRNLIWTLAISVVFAAILMFVALTADGYPLRMLLVIVILVPVMAAIVTFLTLQSGKPRVEGVRTAGSARRAGGERGHYSGVSTYNPGLFLGDAGGDSGGGDSGRGEFGGGD